MITLDFGTLIEFCMAFILIISILIIGCGIWIIKLYNKMTDKIFENHKADTYERTDIRRTVL